MCDGLWAARSVKMQYFMNTLKKVLSGNEFAGIVDDDDDVVNDDDRDDDDRDDDDDVVTFRETSNT